MLVIRYFRVGKKNQPYFKIVVTDKRMPTRGGRFVEEVGFVDPVKKKKTVKADRVKYWISVGAKPSPTVFNLLVSEKIIEGKKIPVHKKKKIKEGEVPVAPAAAPAAAATAAAPAEAPKAEAAQVVETPKVETPKEEKKEEPKIEAPVEEKKIEPPKEEKKIEAPKEEEKPAA